MPNLLSSLLFNLYILMILYSFILFFVYFSTILQKYSLPFSRASGDRCQPPENSHLLLLIYFNLYERLQISERNLSPQPPQWPLSLAEMLISGKELRILIKWQGTGTKPTKSPPLSLSSLPTLSRLRVSTEGQRPPAASVLFMQKSGGKYENRAQLAADTDGDGGRGRRRE